METDLHSSYQEHSGPVPAERRRRRWMLFLAWLALVGLVLLVVLAVPAMAQSPTPEPEVYVVQPGDTLFSIAQRFDSTVEAIVAANDIQDASLINPGQKLIIPTVEQVLSQVARAGSNSRLHPIKPGESLPALAFRYGTTVWALRAENDLNRFGLLWPGQELRIPTLTAEHSQVPGFPQVDVGPSPVVQGQTLLIEVTADVEMGLSGTVLGQDLWFHEQEGGYWALAGVNAMTAAGGYPLTLEAVEVESGDLLTMQATFTVTKGGFGTYNVVVSQDREGLLAPDLSEAERQKVNAVYADISDVQLWSDTFGLPLAGEIRVTAPFGQRRSYNSGPVSSYHSGQDLGADVGVPVLAPSVGTVVLAEALDVRGNAVILDHGLGVFTGFWHLSRIDVTVGQTVGRGEVVGLVGNTGLSTGPHLHWEMRVLGVPIDPFQWTRVVFPSTLSDLEGEPAIPELPAPGPEPTSPADG